MVLGVKLEVLFWLPGLRRSIFGVCLPQSRLRGPLLSLCTRSPETDETCGVARRFTLSRLGHARRGQWCEVGMKPEARTPRKNRPTHKPKSKTLTVKAPKKGFSKLQLASE